MTASLKWRSQLCPCGYCPDGTRIEWRYALDVRFKPRRRVSGVKDEGVGAPRTTTAAPNVGADYPYAAANLSGPETMSGSVLADVAAGIHPLAPPRAHTRNVRKALEGP